MVDRTKLAKQGGGIVLCALVGAVAGNAFGRAVPRGSLEWVQAGDVGALIIAAMLIATAGVVFWFTLDERRFRKHVDGSEEGEPIDPGAIRTARLQSLVLIASGVFLAVPVAAAGLELTASRTSAALVAVALALLLLWETRLNFRIWRDSDEMVRQAMLVSCAVCFFGVQMVFISYAALVRLELVPEVGMWSLAVLLMAVYLVVSFVISLRYGFGKA